MEANERTGKIFCLIKINWKSIFNPYVKQNKIFKRPQGAILLQMMIGQLVVRSKSSLTYTLFGGWG